VYSIRRESRYGTTELTLVQVLRTLPVGPTI
jgi:hypothetical protein